jgi:hypothetical protein
MHLASDHAAHPAGDQAMPLASDYSAHSAGAQPTRFSSEHAVYLAGDQAMHLTSDHAARPATQDACHATHSPATPLSEPIPFSPALVSKDPSGKSGSAKLLPYINLQPVACSAALKAYQATHGINANVYTAQSIGATPCASPSPAVSSPYSDHVLAAVSSSSPLEAAHISPTEGDNKQDILTQGQIASTN